MTEPCDAWHLATLFELVAAAVPDRPAILCGTHTLSFGDLDDRADRLAGVFVDRGIGRGDWIALCLRSSAEYLEATLAAVKIGAVPVNVNYRYTAAELHYLLDDADARAVVFHRSFTDALVEASSALPGLGLFLAVDDGDPGSVHEAADYEGAVTSRAPLRVENRRSGSDRYVMYTGGTTGMPKGVLWQHSDLVKGVLLAGGRHGPPRTVGEAVDRARAGGARVLAAAPLMHGLGQWMALGSLLSGNTVVLDESRHFEPRRLWSLAAAGGAAVIGVAGDAMAGPLADVLPDVAGSLDLSALKVVYSSAALLSPAVRGKLLAGLPHIRVVDAYGSSETGPHAQATAVTATGPGERGRFVVDHRTAVLDDALCPVEPGSGAVGWVARTGHIALGYHKDPERTARTFPVIGGVRWSVSGDAATVEADGSIRLLGRGAACVNSGGEKIYPDEVEAALKAHPAIRDAVVVGVPDARFGERVVAVVSSRGGGAIPEADLDRHVRRSLAGYKVPRAYVFVPEVRRSPAGKPDYGWARDEVLQRAGAPTG